MEGHSDRGENMEDVDAKPPSAGAEGQTAGSSNAGKSESEPASTDGKSPEKQDGPEELDGESYGSSLDAPRVTLDESLEQTNPRDWDRSSRPFDRNQPPAGSVVITGVGIGTPETAKGVTDPARSLDATSRLTVSAALEALREAGIPLVPKYGAEEEKDPRSTQWALPKPMRDETGILLASPYPGYDELARALENYRGYRSTFDQLKVLGELRESSNSETANQIDRLVGELKEEIASRPEALDPSLVFKVIAQGPGYLADYVSAQGPGTHISAAEASGSQALAIADDWIRSGRCRRVIIISTTKLGSDHLLRWLGHDEMATDRSDPGYDGQDRPSGSGFWPGIGACALVLESEDAVRERGMRGIAELISSETHLASPGSDRAGLEPIVAAMEHLITRGERRFGLSRQEIAPRLACIMGEAYPPGDRLPTAIAALKSVFGESAAEVIITTPTSITDDVEITGFEDLMAIKMLESGEVPPAPELWSEIDDLSSYYLSKGGRYTPLFALRLVVEPASPTVMTLFRRIPGAMDRVDDEGLYEGWLGAISGYENPDVVVQGRVLQIAAKGFPPHEPRPSTWRYGLAPGVLAPDGDWMPVGDVLDYDTPQEDMDLAVTMAETESPAGRLPEPAEPSTSPGQEEATAEIDSDAVTMQTLLIAAGHTGYAVDKLEMYLDLRTELNEAEHAELVIAVCQAFGIAGYVDLKIGDYPTIAHLIDLVMENHPGLVREGLQEMEEEEEGETTPLTVVEEEPLAAGPTTGAILQIVADRTGYPVDMLKLSLDMEMQADLGIDSVEQVEILEALCEAFDLECPEENQLHFYPTLTHVLDFIQGPISDAGQPQPDGSGLMGVDESLDAGESEAIDAAAEDAAAKEAVAEDAAAKDAAARKAGAIAAVAAKVVAEDIMVDVPATGEAESDKGVANDVMIEDTALDEAVADDVEVEETVVDEDVIDENMTDDIQAAESMVDEVMFDESMSDEFPAEEISSTAVLTEEKPPIIFAITETVVLITAEETGISEKKLMLGTDLETGLGLDEVMHAEVVSTVLESFGIPQPEELNPGDYPTLADLIQFVRESRPDLLDVAILAGQGVERQPESEVETGIMAGGLLAKVVEGPVELNGVAVAYHRRVPVPLRRQAPEEGRPTGITLEGRRIVVMYDRGGVGEALVDRLRELNASTLPLMATALGDELEDRLKIWQLGGPIHGVYWLPALDVEPPLNQMSLDTWRELNRQRIKNLHRTMRALYKSISQPDSFLISATRLGGLHGYGETGATAPLGGSVTGFVKAYKRERGSVLVKAVDFEAGMEASQVARALISETLNDPDVVEVGYRGDDRHGVTLLEAATPDSDPGLALDQATVFLVTGAADTVTNDIIADLATSGGTFYLLDLVAVPDPDDPRVALFRTDKRALREQLIEEIKTAVPEPTPPMIEKIMTAIEREETVLRGIEAVEAAGGRAHYYCVDLLDESAVSTIVDEIRQNHGRIDVVVHAVGLEISRSLADKDPVQFNMVYDLKADGFFNLLQAATDVPIGATVVFSSMEARYGSWGQTDASAANDLLNKVISSLRWQRPGTRGIALRWTAGGRPGVSPDEEPYDSLRYSRTGFPIFREELASSNYHGEVIIGVERLDDQDSST